MVRDHNYLLLRIKRFETSSIGNWQIAINNLLNIYNESESMARLLIVIETIIEK